GRSEFCRRLLSASRAADLLTSSNDVFACRGPRHGCCLCILQEQQLTGCVDHNLNDPLPGQRMKLSPFRATSGLIFALAMLALGSPSSAQQKMAPAAPSAPAVAQAPATSQAPAAPPAPS